MDSGITPLKLQKLLYYIKAWGLVSGKLSVSGQFKAWKDGPVNGYIYFKFKENGNQAILADSEARPIPTKKKS